MAADEVFLYPSSMPEAKDLGYMHVGQDDCFLSGGQFISNTEMNWEGTMEFNLGAKDDPSDGNLGPIKVRARVHFVFGAIEAA